MFPIYRKKIEKIQQPLSYKLLTRWVWREHNSIKATYDQPTADITLSGEG